MIETLQSYVSSAGANLQTLIVIGVGFGSMLAVFGFSSMFGAKDPALERMQAQGERGRPSGGDSAILRHRSSDPKGLMKTLIPTDRRERSEVERQLAIAGMTGAHAVRNFYLFRLMFGILLPAALVVLVWASRTGAVALPEGLETRLGGLSRFQLVQLLGLLVATGFFGPSLWLKSRSNARRRAIEESFPNALDLIQISTEAGLGFDAAMIRVGNELAETAPEISQELLTAQHEIQAGRSRDRALLDMAARTGVEEVGIFANVVLQSIQFGTSISDALTACAKEMRQNREVRAQEMANKLPVKMSAVMASLMLPALLLLTLGPVVIRYIRYFGA